MDSPQSSGKRYDEKYCHECGATIRARAVVCPKCGVKQPAIADDVDDAEEFPGGTNRIAAGIFGILMGGLGIHKFILGYTGTGLIMLLTTVLGSVLSLCLLVPIIGPMAMGLIGFIEGIIYLTKSDREFYRTYVVGKRPWF
jgi:TM2 domain-containing membrane protein YozV